MDIQLLVGQIYQFCFLLYTDCLFHPKIIPDFIPVFGLMDDAGVVALCLKIIDGDLQAYRKWKFDNVVVID